MAITQDKFYVYLHLKSTDGTPFYVGKGNRYRYKSTNKRSAWWNRVVNKYGFDAIIIEDNLTEQEAYDREVYWIKRIGRQDLNEGTLVNLNDGGCGGSVNYLTEKGLKKLRVGKKHTQETKDKLSKMLKGRKNTPEQIAKMAATKTGMKNEGRAKQIINLETGIIYRTVSEAADSVNMKRTTLNAMLKGQNINKTNLQYL